MSREAETLKEAVGEPGLVRAIWHGYEIGSCDGSHYMALALLPTQWSGVAALLAASDAASREPCDGWIKELEWSRWLEEAESFGNWVAVVDKPGGDVIVWKAKYNWDVKPLEMVWVQRHKKG